MYRYCIIQYFKPLNLPEIPRISVEKPLFFQSRNSLKIASQRILGQRISIYEVKQSSAFFFDFVVVYVFIHS